MFECFEDVKNGNLLLGVFYCEILLSCVCEVEVVVVIFGDMVWKGLLWVCG